MRKYGHLMVMLQQSVFTYVQKLRVGETLLDLCFKPEVKTVVQSCFSVERISIYKLFFLQVEIQILFPSSFDLFMTYCTMTPILKKKSHICRLCITATRLPTDTNGRKRISLLSLCLRICLLITDRAAPGFPPGHTALFLPVQSWVSLLSRTKRRRLRSKRAWAFTFFAVLWVTVLSFLFFFIFFNCWQDV